MKRLLTILLVLLSAASFGQKHVYFGPPNTIDSFNLTMWVRQFKMPTVPLISPYWDSAGSVYLNVPEETIYFHNGLVWQPIAGGGGGGGLQHPGPWLVQRGDTVDLDSTNRVAYTLSGATDLKLPTAKAVSDALADVAPLDTLPFYARVTALADSMGVVRDSLQAIRGDIPDVSGFATTSALADSVSGRQKYSDTAVWDATKANLNTSVATRQLYSDTSTWDATRSWVNGRGFGTGTVTLIQLVAGTGVTITPTTAVTTSGTYTISATGATGVQTITSTGSTAIITGTTTVNVEVDTTHSFTFTANNTFTRDITVDSASIGTGNGLSTNIRFGRNAFTAPTTATGVVAMGENAGRLIQTGQNDIHIGRNAGGNTGTAVSGHVGIGTGNLNYSTGDNNTAIGFNVMARAVAWNGIANVACAINALNNLTSGSANSIFGSGAGAALTSGSNNTFTGVSSGSLITTGGSNVISGSFTGNSGGLDIRTLSNRVVLSDGAGNIRAYHNATNWLIGTVTDGSTGILQLNGSLGLNTAGNKINIAEGSGTGAMGQVTLVAGQATVTTSAVTANSRIFLTGVNTSAPPCASCGDLSVGTITAGSQFIINSSSSTDTRVVNYIIFN